jgi:hypothetical protein
MASFTLRMGAVLLSLLLPATAFAKKKDKDKDDDEGDKEAELEKGEVPIEPKEDAISGEVRYDAHLLDFMTFGVGFIGQFGGNFLDKPGDQSVRGVERTKPEYPGFAGFTTGFGPVIEFRWLGYAGIELDILFQSDRGSAELEVTETSGSNVQSAKFHVEIQQDAVHVPLLFKGALPGRIVTPMIFLGPEFVVPSESTTEIFDGEIPNFATTQKYSAKTPDAYTCFTFGLGLEFNLPIPYVDVRIPLQLRGNVNPGVSDVRDERAEHIGTPPDGITEVIYSTEWKFQAALNIGAAVHF